MKGEALAQTLAWAEAMGQQEVACMVVTADCSGMALLEVWITTSWLSGCPRACSVSRETQAPVLWGVSTEGGLSQDPIRPWCDPMGTKG